MRALLILFLVCATTLLGCTNAIPLYSNLSEQDANEIMAVLEEKNIPVKKQISKGLVTLLISDKDVSESIKLLRSMGLPRKEYSSVIDIFSNDKFVSSPYAEHARYVYAISQELEKTISKIDGIVFARVHVALSEPQYPGAAVPSPSVGVLIKYNGTLDSDVLLPQIRNLVTSSIPGLIDAGKERVSVTLLNIQQQEGITKAVSLKQSPGKFFMLLLCAIVLMSVIGWAAWFYIQKNKRKPVTANVLHP